MKKRHVNLLLAMVSASALMLGSMPVLAESDSAKTESSGDAETADDKDASADKESTLEDGVYTAEFATDSSMFHVNEANDKKGELTVKDGKMTIHVSLVSKKIVNLFAGTAEDAQKDGAEIIEPTTDTVKYSDGYTEEVYGFDIPVPAIDEEFDVAILGEKGKWYDHKVSIKNPVKDDAATEKADDSDKKSDGKKLEDLKLEDGTYETEVTLTGGISCKGRDQGQRSDSDHHLEQPELRLYDR